MNTHTRAHTNKQLNLNNNKKQRRMFHLFLILALSLAKGTSNSHLCQNLLTRSEFLSIKGCLVIDLAWLYSSNYSVTTLHISNVAEIWNLSQLGLLTRLSQLRIENVSSLVKFDANLTKLVRLENFTLVKNENLISLDTQLPESLGQIQLSANPNLAELGRDAFALLTRISQIEITQTCLPHYFLDLPLLDKVDIVHLFLDLSCTKRAELRIGRALKWKKTKLQIKLQARSVDLARFNFSSFRFELADNVQVDLFPFEKFPGVFAFRAEKELERTGLIHLKVDELAFTTLQQTGTHRLKHFSSLFTQRFTILKLNKKNFSELSVDLRESMRFVHGLDLSHNLLTSLNSSRDFLPSDLSLIDLSFNRLKFIQHDYFVAFVLLRTLFLDHNPLNMSLQFHASLRDLTSPASQSLNLGNVNQKKKRFFCFFFGVSFHSRQKFLLKNCGLKLFRVLKMFLSSFYALNLK